MNVTSRASLRIDVMSAEGFRSKPYKDTVGKLTIGFGRNLDDVGISKLEGEVLLDHDLATAEQECRKAFAWFVGLNDVRQRALVEMAFNLGLPRLRGFKRTLAAIEAQRFDSAAREMLDSAWSQQVKSRADRLARMMREGTI